MDTKNPKDLKHDSNPDPITGEPGAHPVGVAGGGTGGALAGAAIGGAIGGPIGAVVGGAIGAVSGGLAGKGAAEVVNPTDEDTYWRREHANRPYFKKGTDYDATYKPAYKYGWESASNPTYKGRSFEAAEPELQKNWNTYRGPVTTEWKDVREATRDSYDRVRSSVTSGAAKAGAAAGAAASYTGDKADAVWEQAKGNWHQFKGTVKEKWNDLTDDEIDQMQGHREKIVGKIQEKYGKAKWNEADIARELGSKNRA